MVKFIELIQFPKVVRCLVGMAFCVGKGGDREAGGGHEAGRYAIQAPAQEVATHSLRLFLIALAFMVPAWLSANEAAPAAQNPQLEARVMKIAAELRCLVCQNQTIADSNAGLAVDLRSQVRSMLQEGKGEPEIIDYMTARYGDFVLYRPPVKTSTLLLWAGPGVMLLGGLGVLFVVLRKRSRMAPEHFDPDTPDAQDPHQA